MKKIIYVGIVFLMSFLLTVLRPESLKEVNLEALAESEDVNYGGGTCCKEQDSICVYGDIVIGDYYFVKSGPCPK